MHVEKMALLIPIISVVGGILMIIFLRYYSNIERMAMIERGMNPSDLKLWSRRARDPYQTLRLACTAIGIGVGLFVGNLLRSIDFFDRGGVVAGMVFICGGLGLLAGFFLAYGLQKNNKPEDWDNTI
jgi:hypothetical protein